jgi:hypothetical protein
MTSAENTEECHAEAAEKCYETSFFSAGFPPVSSHLKRHFKSTGNVFKCRKTEAGEIHRRHLSKCQLVDIENIILEPVEFVF